jgi:hypothetical protein
MAWTDLFDKLLLKLEGRLEPIDAYLVNSPLDVCYSCETTLQG